MIDIALLTNNKEDLNETSEIDIDIPRLWSRDTFGIESKHGKESVLKKESLRYGEKPVVKGYLST